MGKIAFLFSGQGAQHPGMGKDFYDNYDLAKQLFDGFETIRPGIKELCFNGTKEELAETKNTQPALYCVDYIAAKLLNENGIKADCVAGFSLGELAALAYAESYTENQGLDIVCHRGEYMQECGKDFDSTMVAVVKSNNETVEKICSQFENVYPVNYNTAQQLVVSGLKDEMEAFKEAVKEAGAKVLPLSVSGGFHCPFMNSAKVKFDKYLKDVSMTRPNLDVYSNYTASVYEDDVKDLLINQIVNPVRWQTIIETMIANGVDTFIEVGTGKTLRKMMAKINTEIKAYNVEDMETLKNVIMEVKGIE